MTQNEYNNGVSLWSDAVFRFALRTCGDTERAKDAVQEAYATLWEQRRRVDFEKGKPYLLSVVYRQLMSGFRHDKVVQMYQPEEVEVVQPDEVFDLREALRVALKRLPETQRAALLLKDVEGYSCRDIADILSLSEKQVTVYLYRARVSMKKTLIEIGYDNND